MYQEGREQHSFLLLTVVTMGGDSRISIHCVDTLVI